MVWRGGEFGSAGDWGHEAMALAAHKQGICDA